MNKMYSYWIFAFVGLVITSLLVGTITLDSPDFDWQLLLQTRIPRTIAIVLSGMSLSVAGVIMQMLANNKFVEPTTTGTVEWAILGMLLLLVFYYLLKEFTRARWSWCPWWVLSMQES